MRVILIAALLASPVFAEEPKVYRLTPTEREAAIASAAAQPERAAPLLMPNPEPGSPGLAPSSERDAILGNSLYGEARPDRRMHGEVSMFVGSGGARGISGTAAVPLGETGSASVMIGTGRFPGFGYGFGQGIGPGYGPGFEPGFGVGRRPNW